MLLARADDHAAALVLEEAAVELHVGRRLLGVHIASALKLAQSLVGSARLLGLGGGEDGDVDM